MRDCRKCACDCVGCQDRRRILTTGIDGPVRSIGCFCGAPSVEVNAEVLNMLKVHAEFMASGRPHAPAEGRGREGE